MHLLDEAVDNPDLVSTAEKLPGNGPPDETRAPRNQDPFPQPLVPFRFSQHIKRQANESQLPSKNIYLLMEVVAAKPKDMSIKSGPLSYVNNLD
jgi:hypothetical protein